MDYIEKAHIIGIIKSAKKRGDTLNNLLSEIGGLWNESIVGPGKGRANNRVDNCAKSRAEAVKPAI